MATVISLFLLVPIMAIIIGTCCLLTYIVFNRCLGKRYPKCRMFSVYAISWLSMPFSLPGEMKRNGVKRWWWGI